MTLKDEVRDAIMACGGLDSLTSKLDIGSDSIYVTTAWMKGNIVHLDITLSRGSYSPLDDLPTSEAVATLESAKYDLARSWVEDSCRMASRMLESGVDIDEIVANWKGVKGAPDGVCPQLESIVPGPLHAAAALIERRKDAWKILLTKQWSIS